MGKSFTEVHPYDIKLLSIPNELFLISLCRIVSVSDSLRISKCVRHDCPHQWRFPLHSMTQQLRTVSKHTAFVEIGPLAVQVVIAYHPALQKQRIVIEDRADISPVAVEVILA